MREQILATATELFVQRGYEGVAMREIADACGITKPALYYHFAGKSAVLNAICVGYLDQVADVVADSADHGTGETRLRWLVHGLFALPPARRAIMRLAMHDLDQLEPDDRAAFGRAYVERFLQPITELFAAGSATGEFVDADPTLLTRLLLGVLYPFFAPPRDEGAGEPVDDLLDVFCGGVLRRG
jgi:AcrR family transcriptional regulator